ncbi:hypothetical protein ACIBG8_33800 [Nonomuraea sp. NPDC050556]|uniref:hypothetical protein n=1 Tax=Nonomuraea sp. NPDC050556 TaxID=3364369 RepID=UPI0037BC9143
MSLYGVNAFMREINMQPLRHAAYVADQPGYVSSWERAPLSEHERAALSARDYGALYAMGAHPYLLWSFTEAVWVPEVTRAELVESFRARAIGYPDVAT